MVNFVVNLDFALVCVVEVIFEVGVVNPMVPLDSEALVFEVIIICKY